eukprot:1158850-Pelagomonas_calceolata.AAC.1
MPRVGIKRHRPTSCQPCLQPWVTGELLARGFVEPCPLKAPMMPSNTFIERGVLGVSAPPQAMSEQGGEQRQQQQQRPPPPPRVDFQLSFHCFLKKEPEDPKFKEERAKQQKEEGSGSTEGGGGSDDLE